MTMDLPLPNGRLLTELNDADFNRFKSTCDQRTDAGDYPLCQEVAGNVVVFDASDLEPKLSSSTEDRYAVMEELQRALLSGPGVFVMRNMIAVDTIDKAVRVGDELNPRSKHAGAKASRRTFAYNEKHAQHDPESYAEYYGNDVLAAVCEAWLGPSYQLTATLNATFVGGIQQDIHRDYHVSHQALDRIKRFPVVNQIASQFLTLQSAIAHTDMPLPTGPTCFMPYSQLFDKGYTAVRDQAYIDYVKPRMVQLELKKGDAVFFNPATFHQPGVNVTDDERTANLLQVSSAFGRSMESCDRLAMTKAVWPVIKRWNKEIASGGKGRTQAQLDALIAATSSDYGYPKIIDLVVPGCPETQAGVVKEALAAGTADEEVYKALDEHQAWHKP